MAEIVAEGQACIDCALLIANDDTSGMTDGAAAELRANVAGKCVGLDPVMACPDECEGFFSWAGCDVCGSSLGGDFHPVVFFAREGVAL